MRKHPSARVGRSKTNTAAVPSAPGLPAFPRALGETPRAFNAFATFFQLGHRRSLQAVASRLGENLATVKNWSSKYAWSSRIRSHTAGLLEKYAAARAAAVREHAATVSHRTLQLREQEWTTAQKLLGAAQCFLDGFGDPELHRMSLSQVSRALQIASRIGRHSLVTDPLPDEPASLAPVQTELLSALNKMFGPSPDPAVPDLPGPPTADDDVPVPSAPATPPQR